MGFQALLAGFTLLAQAIGKREQCEAGQEGLEAHEVRQRKHSELEVDDRPNAKEDGDDAADDQPPPAMRLAEADAGSNRRTAGDYCPGRKQKGKRDDGFCRKEDRDGCRSD